MQDCIGEEGGGMVVWDKKGILYVYWRGTKGQGCTGVVGCAELFWGGWKLKGSMMEVGGAELYT